MVSPLYLLLALPPPHWKGSCLLQQHGIQLVTKALLARRGPRQAAKIVN